MKRDSGVTGAEANGKGGELSILRSYPYNVL